MSASEAGRPVGPSVGMIALLALLALIAQLGGCASSSDGDAASRDARRTLPDPIDVIDAWVEAHPVDRNDRAWKLHVPRPPAVRFPADKRYFWSLATSEGRLKIELYPEYAPRHVASTIYLTRLGFYDGLGFHRIIPKQIAQGGDPLGVGIGGPGYHYGGEFHKKARHDERGIVSMANAGPNTDGSQFFILFAEAPHLDDKHSVFGKVVGGMGTLRSIEALGSEKGKPRRAVTILHAGITVEDRD